MTALVTLDQALAHLKLPPAATLLPADVADLQLKLDTAHEEVLDYVKDRNGPTKADWIVTVDAWTPDDAPKVVLLAIEMQFGEWYRFHSDEDRPSRSTNLPLSPEATALLARVKDPVFA